MWKKKTKLHCNRLCEAGLTPCAPSSHGTGRLAGDTLRKPQLHFGNSLCQLGFSLASVTVVGSLIYNISMKLGSAKTSVFVFVLILSVVLTLIQAASFLIAKYAFKVDVTAGLTSQSIFCAVTAAGGVALIDIFYALALRYASPIQCQIFLDGRRNNPSLYFFRFFFFKETITLSKGFGSDLRNFIGFSYHAIEKLAIEASQIGLSRDDRDGRD